jgi:hypothetical protein
MPPRGVKKGTKRARQYEKIKRSARKRGASASRARELAARTVNKNRARSGESRTRLAQLDQRLLPSATGWPAIGHEPAERPDQGAALQPGEAPAHRGPFQDEQEPVATSRGCEEPMTRRGRVTQV